MSNRADMIIEYFNYLINDFGFSVTQREFDTATMGNAYVIFKSPKVGVEIVIDRNQVLITLGSSKDSKSEWFEFCDVLKYFAPFLENAYVFIEKSNNNTWENIVQIQLGRIATQLRQYCEPLLRGDFSMRSEIERIQKHRRTELLKNLTNLSSGDRKGD